MGTWETDKFNAGACPCGTGHINRIVESPDNAWSRAHTSYELSCADCEAGWDMSYSGTLTERASEGEYEVASEKSSKATQGLQNYLNSLLASFTFPTFKRMADEFEFLFARGLYRGTIGQYRYARRTGDMSAIAEIRPNSAFVSNLVKTHGDGAQYQGLVDAAKKASDVAEAKYKSVKRFRYS